MAVNIGRQRQLLLDREVARKDIKCTVDEISVILNFFLQQSVRHLGSFFPLFPQFVYSTIYSTSHSFIARCNQYMWGGVAEVDRVVV